MTKGKDVQYYKNITDHETGEVFRISIGEHLTITESARLMEVRRSDLTAVLLKTEVCRKEYDEVAEKTRIRLHPDAAEKGFGFRVMGEKGPFDVLSPLCREYIEDELKVYLYEKSPERYKPVFSALHEFEADRKVERMTKLNPQMKVCWIVDYFGDVPAEIIAKGIGVAQSLVYRYLHFRREQLEGRMHPLKKKLKKGTAEFYGFDPTMI